jgi:hypothetical protein
VPVVITPQERHGELAGGLRILERQLATRGLQQVVRELAPSSLQIGELPARRSTRLETSTLASYRR